jgi:hypothetical protein
MKQVVHTRRMYIPGRVLHLTPNKKYGRFASFDAVGKNDSASRAQDAKEEEPHDAPASQRDTNGHGYTPWWVEDIDMFQEILISGSMFVDHMPDIVMGALQSVEIDPPGGGGGSTPGEGHVVPTVVEWRSADRNGGREVQQDGERDVTLVPLGTGPSRVGGGVGSRSSGVGGAGGERATMSEDQAATIVQKVQRGNVARNGAGKRRRRNGANLSVLVPGDSTVGTGSSSAARP